MTQTTGSPWRQDGSLETKVQGRPHVPEQRNCSQEELQALKTRLLRPILEKTEEPELRKRIGLAANEALAMAWSRPLPFLILPSLLEDKVREVQRWYRRQQQILALTGGLFKEWWFKPVASPF